MRFEFATAARIVFGSGAAGNLPAIIREYGRRPFVVTGRDPARAAPITGPGCHFFPVAGEPTLDIVRAGVEAARAQTCDVIVAVGGGSAIDAGKAIAALVTNSGEPLDYLEVIGKAQPIERTPLPFIAVPTTAGTGSEVTRNAVLGSPEHGVKASLRSPLMLARVALVDPELTLGLPPEITASTGLDALTQLIEPYVSVKANPVADLFCLDGMCRASASLVGAVRNGTDRGAREHMSYASLMGGLALANAGLGVVHGFAAPIGGMSNAAHGAICAAILPHGMAVNIQALRSREPRNPALERYGEIARLLTCDCHAEAEEGAEWVLGLCGEIGIASLGALGISTGQVPEIVEKSARASSMKGNPIVLTAGELAEVLERAGVS